MKQRGFKIKVCGMREPGNVKDVAALGPDFMGFIFYPGSKRYVGQAPSPEIFNQGPDIITTGVFVKEPNESVLAICKKYDLKAVQFHGGESAADCWAAKDAGLLVLKVFSVTDNFDFNLLKEFEPVSDYFLFDTAGAGYGGTGHTFEHSILEKYPSHIPYLLSGGMDLEGIKNILGKFKLFPGLAGFDLNSRYEDAPGMKNTERLAQTFDFINTFK